MGVSGPGMMVCLPSKGKSNTWLGKPNKNTWVNIWQIKCVPVWRKSLLFILPWIINNALCIPVALQLKIGSRPATCCSMCSSYQQIKENI